jgi:hypothetical protein
VAIERAVSMLSPVYVFTATITEIQHAMQGHFTWLCCQETRLQHYYVCLLLDWNGLDSSPASLTRSIINAYHDSVIYRHTGCILGPLFATVTVK